MEVKALAHAKNDSVAVATDDLKEGEEIQVAFLDNNEKTKITTAEVIPLGHKISLKDIKKGENVIEYGEVIGAATKDIKKGEHVHIHNIKSLRW
ncbi:UxaA family hydrolase [Acidiplasma sp.]|uniref:UxaA family hydrolase n=1 Tax=Acidiplasma sp. TaxID=1872114 RepID=UPI00258DA57B|nr:UxaA family hydrolase [Acidiplasma sp.]